LFGRITPEHARWVRDLNLGATVHIHPALPYLGSLSQIRQADFVLLIDAPAAESVFLPAKLIDYLGVGAPILALTPEKGVTSALVQGRTGSIKVLHVCTTFLTAQAFIAPLAQYLSRYSYDVAVACSGEAPLETPGVSVDREIRGCPVYTIALPRRIQPLED